MKLKFTKLHPDAIVPQYQSAGAGCLDLHAILVEEAKPHPRDPHATIFRTGLAFEVPPEWMLEVHSRSGQGFKDAVRLSNCEGQIDPDYRGEIFVALRFDGSDGTGCPKVRNGDRIAQVRLCPAPRIELEEVAELSATDRGTNGLGSTGNA